MENNIVYLQNKKALARTGNIFSNYALIATIIGGLCYLGIVISAILSIVFFLFLFCAVVFTFGLILLSPGVKNLFSNSGDRLSNFFSFLIRYVPYLFAFGAVMALLGFVFTLFDFSGSQKKKNIIKSIICLILCVIGFVFSLAVK